MHLAFYSDDCYENCTNLYLTCFFFRSFYIKHTVWNNIEETPTSLNKHHFKEKMCSLNELWDTVWLFAILYVIISCSYYGQSGVLSVTHLAVWGHLISPFVIFVQ